MGKKIKVIVAGCGNMGSSHARAYQKLEGFDLAGLVDKFSKNREALSEELGGIRQFDDFDSAMKADDIEAIRRILKRCFLSNENIDAIIKNHTNT